MILRNNGNSKSSLRAKSSAILKEIVLAYYLLVMLLVLGSGINHVKRKGKMKCTECGLAQKREGIRGEKRKGKSRGSLSFLSLPNLLFFSLPSLPFGHLPRRPVSQGYKRSKT